MAGIASGLIAVVLIGVLVASHFGARTGAAARVSSSPSTADAGPITWFAGDQFKCARTEAFGLGPAPQIAHVKAVGAATNIGYDRFTIQFADGQPAQSDLLIQDSARFTEVPGGGSVVLKGEAGALLTLHATDGHASFKGPSELKTEYPVVLEMRRVQDFGGTVQWAVGLSRTACYRVGFVSSPASLVIDFRLRQAA
ncbi:MAG TPA: hypothetical protein VJP81_06905 [Candidatus Dormibacteraeota bacterium]|nr:hypothetical protein [Candidatus Dormibacteraeota bacterium]